MDTIGRKPRFQFFERNNRQTFERRGVGHVLAMDGESDDVVWAVVSQIVVRERRVRAGAKNNYVGHGYVIRYWADRRNAEVAARLLCRAVGWKEFVSC